MKNRDYTHLPSSNESNHLFTSLTRLKQKATALIWLGNGRLGGQRPENDHALRDKHQPVFTVAFMIVRAALLPLLSIGAVVASAQVSPDPQILAEVNRIRAVDDHTHVMKVVDPGRKGRRLRCVAMRSAGSQ